MTARFREFVNAKPFCIKMEQEAAPSGVSPTSPSNPDSGKTDKYHFDAMKMQMGIDDDDFDAALEDSVVSLYPPKEFVKSRWNMSIIGMVPAKVSKRSDGNYDVTFMLDTKKSMQPKSFFMPDQTKTKKDAYDSKVIEKKEILNPEELQGMMTPAYRGGGQIQAGGGAPIGGGSPLGG